MLTRSGSDTPGHTSPDHTGHALFRSTRVLPSNQRHEAGTGPAPGPGPGPVQITIQKLRQKPGQAPPPGAAGSSQSGRDVVTSRFGAGARGLVLAALKHRCHSAPHRREVTGQLSTSQDALRGAGPISGCLGDTAVIESQPLMTGHTPVTSDLTASGQTPRLQVTHLDSTAGLLQQTSRAPSRAASIAVETGPVAMATPHHDQWTETSRDQYLRGASIVSTVTQQPAGSHLLSWTNHSEGAARTANETLREMGCLKAEMKMLLTPEDSLKTTTPGPDHIQSQQNLFQSQQSKSQQTKSQSQQTDFQQSQSHQSPFQSIRSQHSQTRSQLSQQFQSVLVQRKPVVPSTLEEAGLVLRHVRRQKKVLEENLEALLRDKTGEVLYCQLDALAANRDWTEEVRIKKTVDAWISTSTRDIQVEMSSEEAAMTSQQRAAGSSAHTGRGRPVSTLRGIGSERGSRVPVQGAEPESYLSRLYGRAPYEGVRRTLKKSPYLRFSSPVSPLGRKPRPQLVETVTGVKVKSCKTQTSPRRPQSRDIIGSSQLTSGDLTVTVPMAIPLGRPRMDSSSRCLAKRQQEVTSPPAAPPTCSVVAVFDGASESQKVEQLDAPPLPLVDIIKSKSKEEEDEEDVFPGTEFLSNVVQQEELSFNGEEEVQLDGGPSPPPVLYQGPVFPPQTRSALPPQDQGSVLDLNLQRDVLENRLVEWVEQQLMSRMISEMYRPLPSDPAQNDSTDQSESEEQSAASDIVEAAGGGGLQLFVDSNMSVDSALIRQLVGEVLTEQVALLLGQRDSLEPGPDPRLEPAEPGPGSLEEDKLVPLVPTPVPTPPPSPAPPSRETPPMATPPPSEPTSLLNDESPRPITAPEPVAMPTSSPEPAPSAGSPPSVHQAPPPLTWGDVELPLDEERPEEHLDTRSQLLVMSVAEEEPLVSSPLPPSSTPPAPSPSPPPGPRPESASSSSEESSSTATAETEAALKHISEGELLLSVNQLAAMTEEPVSSFSSSLQELHDMDFDPHSEGHVKGQDLLKTKMEQRDTQPEGCWKMDTDQDQDQDQEEVSLGEVRRTRTARQDQTWSPGQMSQCADVSDVSFEATNQSSVVVGDLMMEPIGTLTSDLQTDGSLTPPHLEDTHTTGQQPISREDS